MWLSSSGTRQSSSGTGSAPAGGTQILGDLIKFPGKFHEIVENLTKDEYFKREAEKDHPVQSEKQLKDQIAEAVKVDPAKQWAAGEAFCISCDHKWAAVAPTGSLFFECPGCRRFTGRWKFTFGVPSGLQVRGCNCGNQLFYLTPEGHLCANCGIYQSY